MSLERWGKKVVDVELVCTALNGVAKPWTVFVESMVAREHMPSWDRLRDDFIQEETRRWYIHGSASHSKEEEENVALAAKGKKKKKFKKGSKDGAKRHDREKKDMSKVKCFVC